MEQWENNLFMLLCVWMIVMHELFIFTGCFRFRLITERWNIKLFVFVALQVRQDVAAPGSDVRLAAVGRVGRGPEPNRRNYRSHPGFYLQR